MKEIYLSWARNLDPPQVAPQPAEHSPPPGRGLLIVATTSEEAGKRDQAQNEGQFRKIPRRSKVLIKI